MTERQEQLYNICAELTKKMHKKRAKEYISEQIRSEADRRFHGKTSGANKVTFFQKNYSYEFEEFVNSVKSTDPVYLEHFKGSNESLPSEKNEFLEWITALEDYESKGKKVEKIDSYQRLFEIVDRYKSDEWNKLAKEHLLQLAVSKGFNNIIDYLESLIKDEAKNMETDCIKDMEVYFRTCTLDDRVENYEYDFSNYRRHDNDEYDENSKNDEIWYLRFLVQFSNKDILGSNLERIYTGRNTDDGFLDYILSNNAYDRLEKEYLEKFPDDRSIMNTYDLSEIELEISWQKWDMHLCDVLCDLGSDNTPDINNILTNYFTLDVIKGLLDKNPNFDKVIRIFKKNKEEAERIQKNISELINGGYAEMFPEARKIHRQFILHVGPTNSGKTYDAMQSLMKSEKGVYLAPLRLLAFEQYEKLNSNGCSCSLVTGEEEFIVDDAKHRSSTVEMLNLSERYDVAVIDEAQMITDKFRGGAWTQAILGVQADVVHVCTAPHAEELLLRMIDECGDEATVVRHERKTPLSCENKNYDFPESVKKGDALIVFSRKSVHAVAGYLEENGYRCSIIYGALPYDIRHEEARKFAAGETDILVATDAIGMGMNLPIKRIVFLETNKFDGERVRMLMPEEIHQIAGRAGRAGLYNEGFYTTLWDENLILIKKCMEVKVPAQKNAGFFFPQMLINIEGTVSNILTQWAAISSNEGYMKSDTQREKGLSERLESIIHESKRTDIDYKKVIYDFALMHFDEDDTDLCKRWESVFKKIINRKKYSPVFGNLPSEIQNEMDMDKVEKLYAAADLEYQMCRKYGELTQAYSIMEYKQKISKLIMDYLSGYKLKGKKCEKCGQDLVLSRFRLCDDCYAKQRRSNRRSYRSYYDEYIEDLEDDDDMYDWRY